MLNLHRFATVFIVAFINLGLATLVGCDSRGDARQRPTGKNQAAKQRRGPARPVARKVSAATHRAAERDIDELIMRGMNAQVWRDIYPDKPYRIDLFNDDGHGRVAGSYWVQRVQIDFDRDNRWDEKWKRVMRRGTVVTVRRVSPADDGHYTETYEDRDDGKGWVRVGG